MKIKKLIKYLKKIEKMTGNKELVFCKELESYFETSKKFGVTQRYTYRRLIHERIIVDDPNVILFELK